MLCYPRLGALNMEMLLQRIREACFLGRCIKILLRLSPWH